MNGQSGTDADGPRRIFVAGGTGFVGTNLQKALAGHPLRLLVRERANYPSDSAQIEYVEGDLERSETLEKAIAGCDVVINLVAIIEEEGGATFDGVIRQGTVKLVEAAKRAGVKRFMLMSAMGAHHDPQFGYFEAKWQAEQAVKASGIPWTIFRPSIIFGPGDGFINVLADLVRKAPVIPVVGSGLSKFQPVAVGDVADSFAKAVVDSSAVGQTYELGGPDIFTYEQLLDAIAERLNKRKPKVHVSIGLMKAVVAMSKPLPKALRPPVTSEQLKMLAIDNCTDHSATAGLIGRRPLDLKNNMDYVVK